MNTDAINWVNTSRIGYETFWHESQNLFVLIPNEKRVDADIDAKLQQNGFKLTAVGLVAPVKRELGNILKSLPGVREIKVRKKGIKYDNNIGRTWWSALGRHRIIQKRIIDDQCHYLAQIDRAKELQVIPTLELRQVLERAKQEHMASWQAWNVINPDEHLIPPDGYEIFHIKRPGKKVERIIGQAISLKQYQTVSMFLGKKDGEYTVFLTQVGRNLGGSGTNRQDAIRATEETLKQNAPHPGTLVAFVSGSTRIPQTGDLSGDLSQVVNGLPHESDDLLGHTWETIQGKHIITDRQLVDNMTCYLLADEHGYPLDHVPVDAIHQRIQEDEEQVKAIAQEPKGVHQITEETETLTAIETAITDETFGFTDNLIPMRKSQVLKVLNTPTYFNEIWTTRKEMIRTIINHGGTIEVASDFDEVKQNQLQLALTLPDQIDAGIDNPVQIKVLTQDPGPNSSVERLYLPDRSFLDIKSLTKTGMDYAKHLLALKSVPENEPEMSPA